MTLDHLIWIAGGALALIGVRYAIEWLGRAVLTWHKRRNPPQTPIPAHDSSDPDV